MRELNYALKQLCRNCREGSYATQQNRERILTQAASELHAMGYRRMQAKSLKPKHIEALVELWRERELSIGTIKNRMAALRWWAIKVNKLNVIAKSNEFYGIPDRRFVTNENKARDLTEAQLSKVKDNHVRMSLELQRTFGLRREEAMKFTPSYADKGDRIQLKASWTKGGKPRTIPIRTETQRDVLDRARSLAGFGSLIPPHRSYVQQLRVYEGHTTRAGLSSMHGLRHAYAQDRYEELTSWKCPVAGGPGREALSPEQRALDHEARLTISQELGHERSQITTAYLGK
ncbi:MAG: integrase domain-containing protein [Gammaproteobacteria bacterium]|nr:integrase domain-containing protein [Gammaproteobacteria bacterium]